MSNAKRLSPRTYDGRECIGFILARGKLALKPLIATNDHSGFFKHSAAAAIMKKCPADESRAKTDLNSDAFTSERKIAQAKAI
jgi:hypothetical protein